MSSYSYAEEKKVYFAGGCFWCMEESFDQVEGVISTISGYSGGHLKNPKYAYDIILDSSVPEKQITFWNDLQDPTCDKPNWEKTHIKNFKCTISTRIRSFYYKLFHRAIGLNNFLYKI